MCRKQYESQEQSKTLRGLRARLEFGSKPAGKSNIHNLADLRSRLLPRRKSSCFLTRCWKEKLFDMSCWKEKLFDMQKWKAEQNRQH